MIGAVEEEHGERGKRKGGERKGETYMMLSFLVLAVSESLVVISLSIPDPLTPDSRAFCRINVWNDSAPHVWWDMWWDLFQVFKLGLAKSIHHARTLIKQRHIRVGKQICDIPSFLVRVDRLVRLLVLITPP